MKQKTYEILTIEDAIRVAEDMKKNLGGKSYSISLKVLSFILSYEETYKIISPICEEFPDAILTGLSVHALSYPGDNHDVVEFDETPMIRLSFFMFEKSDVIQIIYDFDKQDKESILKDIRSRMRDVPNLKGVNISIAGYATHISDFLEELVAGFEDVPVFGTLADMYYVSALDRKEEAYIFNREGSVEKGIAFLLFTGEELHVDAKCIFGWKPIGKAMSVEVADVEMPMGDTTIKTIDGQNPEEIYRKYLGIGFDEYLTVNTCEFPLAVERNGITIGRTPFDCTKDGEIIFVGAIRPYEKVRFSYTIRDELIENTEKETRNLIDFSPQAIELFVCGNRAIVLRSDAALETKCFTRFVPDTLECHASGEIYFHHGRGDFLNSTIVAAVFREGDVEEISELEIEKPAAKMSQIVPLTERLSKFTQAMSGDLVDYALDAQQANAAKSAFLASMSHEIRTPINAILGMDEMILRETKEDVTYSYARDIMSASKTLLSIVNDILDLSKVEEGKMEIIPTQYDLPSLINEIVGMIKDRAISKGLEFNVEVNERIPYLLVGDEIRIRQCVMNLLTNAVKYTERGSVTFTVDFKIYDETSIFLTFFVRDTGIGMKSEDMKNLFAPYKRIEEERNRSIEGTGLGMSITRQLLELMGTSLDVESVYGEGSVFFFDVFQEVVSWEEIGDYTKRIENVREESEYHELFHAPDARILIIDDTEMNHTVMEGFLKKTKIKIDSAMSGREGLELADKNEYDVIFIDHMMPDMDGIETLAHMRESDTNKDTPVIALTANAVSGAKEMYLSAGFEEYLSKPVNGMRLEQMLKNLIPDDKIYTPTGVDGLESDSVEDSLLECLNGISDMDVQEGIANSGSLEGYLSVLKVFHLTATAKANEIEELYNKQDIPLYTVKVHALKSSARIIGARELSQLAEKLEEAGNNNDIKFIEDNTDRVLRMYRELDLELSVLDVNSEELPKIDSEELKEAYKAMVEIAMTMDYGLMDNLISDLRKYRLDPEDDKKVSQIEKLLTELDWDGIVRLVK